MAQKREPTLRWEDYGLFKMVNGRPIMNPNVQATDEVFVVYQLDGRRCRACATEPRFEQQDGQWMLLLTNIPPRPLEYRTWLRSPRVTPAPYLHERFPYTGPIPVAAITRCMAFTWRLGLGHKGPPE